MKYEMNSMVSNGVWDCNISYFVRIILNIYYVCLYVLICD